MCPPSLTIYCFFMDWVGFFLFKNIQKATVAYNSTSDPTCFKQYFKNLWMDGIFLFFCSLYLRLSHKLHLKQTQDTLMKNLQHRWLQSLLLTKVKFSQMFLAVFSRPPK